MRNRGIETWRIHCDSAECYMIYLLVNTDDISKITEEEYDEVIDYAYSLGIRNAFIQEGDTAEESFIPDFNKKSI